MTGKAKIAIAVGGSALGHLLLIGGAVGWIAFGGIPGNDDFSLRFRLGAAKEVNTTGSNYAASREPGEPLHAGVPGQSGSIWWSWQAPEKTRDVLIETELVGGEPLVGVYTGFAVGKLEVVAQSGNGTLSFAPQVGVDYHIAVAGHGRDAEGVVNLRIRAFDDEDSQPELLEQKEPALDLPEIVVEEEKPKTLNYVRTTQNERAASAPEDAAFESDRNTVAASELPPDDQGLENMPSQDGVDRPFFEMADRDVTDGELADDATIPIVSVELFQPQMPEEAKVEEIELQPAEEGLADAEELTEPAPVNAAENLIDEPLLAETGELAAEMLAVDPPEDPLEDAEPQPDPVEAKDPEGEELAEEIPKPKEQKEATEVAENMPSPAPSAPTR